MNQRIWLSSEFEIEVCINCGIVFAVVKKYIDKRRKDHRTFYCPNGHGQHYSQMSKEEQLKDQLKHCQLDRDFWLDEHGREQEKRTSVERSRSSLRGAFTKLKKRLGNGK